MTSIANDDNNCNDNQKNFESNIDISKLTIGEMIGQGNFASVHKGTYGDDKELVAVKKQSLEDPELLKYVHSEIDILKTIEHPNVLNYIGICFLPKENSLYIVTEYLNGGDLRDFIIKESTKVTDGVGNIDWRLRTKIVMDIGNAIYYLHSHNLMHRDIKTDNVILSSDQRFVLCDFGFATFVDKAKRRKTLTSAEVERRPQRTMSFCGTDEFMSPEQMFGIRYGFPSDVFSYGIFIAEVVSGKAPGIDGHLLRYPQNGFCFEDDEELRKMMPKTAPYSLVELCVQCCAAEPDDRPTAYDVYEWARELYDELKGSSIINPGDNQEDAVDENYNEKKSNVSNVTDIDGNNTLLEKETQNDGNNETSDSNSNNTQEENKTNTNNDNNNDTSSPSNKGKQKNKRMGNKRRSSIINAEFDDRTFNLDLNALEFNTVVKKTDVITAQIGTYNDNVVFVKTIKFDTNNFANDTTPFKEELDVLKNLFHTNVVKYIGATVNVDEGNVYLCMEYLSGGTLHDFLISKHGGLNNTFPWTLKLHFATELCSALKHLHNRNLVHRDLRSSKIMLSKGMRLVLNYSSIWDNGSNRSSSDKDQDRELFCAPEIYEEKNRLTKDKFTWATDMFGLGLILLEIGCGKSISKTFPKRDVNNNYSIYNTEFLEQHILTENDKIEEISQKYYGICTDACHFNPTNRPTSYELHDKLTDLSHASHKATARNATNNIVRKKEFESKKMYRGKTYKSLKNITGTQQTVDVDSLTFMKTGEYEFAGILQKRGRWNPQWKSRAFAIRKSAIDYFRCDNNKTQQIGSLPFDSLMVFEKNQVATAVPKKNRLFKLCTQRRTYYLQAKDEKERDQWIHEINKVSETWRASMQ
jgi:serine/threonine protein kinase